jgi:hypothetical protein
MEIEISLLMDVIQKGRFDLEIKELVEMVRALDILGAGRMLLDYEALMYVRLYEVFGQDRIKKNQIFSQL